MMNCNQNRRPYSAPSAEIVCLIPSVPIANSNWKWGDQNKNWKVNHWGDTPDILDILENASVTGLMEWAGEDELDLPK